MDFSGQYHLFKIKAKYPIPGMALAVDNQRKAQKEVRVHVEAAFPTTQPYGA